MKKNKLHKWIILIIVLVLLVITAGAFYLKNTNNKKKSGNETVVKDNVRVITKDSDITKSILSVEEDRIVFSENPKYKKGDVITAGIIPDAKDGFIRRVTEVKKEGSKYIIETEPAYLTDVFEKAHIVKNYKLTEDGLEKGHPDVKQEESRVSMQKVSYDSTKIVRDTSSTAKQVDMADSEDDEEEESEDDGYMFGASFDEEIENIHISGEAGFDVWLELRLDIDNGKVQFGMAVRDKTGASLHLAYGSDLQKEIEKVIYEKELPNFTFDMAGVPIVVTNDLAVVLNGNVKVEGSMSLDYQISSENTHGFLYDSRKSEVEEINEHTDNSDGVHWTTVQVSGESSADIAIHLTTQLYGCTGMDFSGGISGKAEGEAKVTTNPDLAGYAGKLDLSITPKVSGTLVVTVPIVDEKLVEQPLFAKELKPFWEKHWKSSSEWKKDMEWTETGEKGTIDEEGNVGVTYTTRYGEVNMITCPKFQFDIPSGWSVTTEEVGDGTTPVEENVVITNDRNVTVSYWSCLGALGAATRMLEKSDVTKVADSQFVPSYPAGTNTDFSYLGPFVVAKVKAKATMDMQLDSDYTEIDGGTFYAVVPESYLGEHEYVKQVGDIDEFSFDYPRPHAFIAESPDGKFTEKEEKEVIEILKSFRVAE